MSCFIFVLSVVNFIIGNPPKSFNLPSIINSKRQSQQMDSDAESSFYQNEDSDNGLSPDIMKRKKAKGLHNYEGNKENIVANNSPRNSCENQFRLAIKPTQMDTPTNEIKMNFGWDPMNESEYNPVDTPHNLEPPPLDEAEQFEASSLFESVYVMDGEADQIKRHIKSEMEKFNIAYDIDAKWTIDLSPEEKEMLYNPYFDDIFNYIKYVWFKSKMESEIPIISLIYIEKLLRKWGVLVNYHNWRRIVLITLCIGSKIWDDDSLENIHFPKVMYDVTLKDISTLENTFLNLIEYDVIIRGKEYAKYYFIMTTLGKDSKKNPPWRLMNPSNVQKIEGESAKMQEKLKNQYDN